MSDQLIADTITITTCNKHEETSVHTLSRIQTQDPSNCAALDLHLRPDGH